MGETNAKNPEIGGEDGCRQMAAALKAEGMGIIIDIVPNHLAVGGSDNGWWLDVLEKGEASAFAQLFDIDWRPRDPALQGKVLAPFLGAPYGEALAGGDIQLEAGPDGSLWATAYGHHRFPIRAADRAEVFKLGLEAYDPAKEPGRARLHALLERQAYRLAWWQSAGDEINWRRFFDITELAGVRVEIPEVFDRIHALPLRPHAEGLIDGLRIDHIDGLADPAGYLTRLRGELAKLEAARPTGSAPGPAYLVVEKILAEGEALSRDWACDGTTGHEFIARVSAPSPQPAPLHPAGRSGRAAGPALPSGRRLAHSGSGDRPHSSAPGGSASRPIPRSPSMKPVLLIAPLALLAACSPKAEVDPAVTASDAWCRPAVAGARAVGCYVTLQSAGEDRLVGAQSPAGARLEIHTMSMDGGVMRMRKLEDGLPLPAGETVALKPGAEHLMLIGPKIGRAHV